jgi:hypothetical protein
LTVTVASAVHATGFHLVILCHRFGRRGRAFAASLARQILNPYEMRLTCFYSEEQDAHYLLEGASSGNSPLVVTTVRVPPDRIMQRAIHFSSVRHEDRCSHVVYLDGDLWFPPDFWRCYGHALAQESPGYWSAHVMETPTETAERLTDDWQHLTEKHFRRHSEGPRHDRFAGKVGHFQCVPRELANYPQDPIQAVNQSFQANRPRQRLQHRVDHVVIDHLPAYFPQPVEVKGDILVFQLNAECPLQTFQPM